MTEKYINPEQLCIGLHIRLESSWMEHSFIITSFKIKNDKQLNKLSTSGIAGGLFGYALKVILSDERIAVVLSVNMDDLLNPNLIIYDPAIPKEEAMIIRPKEEGLSILESIRKSTLSKEVLAYLDLGESVSFFIDVKNT